MKNGISTTQAETLEDALQGKGCLGRALPDEPVFVLRSRDVTFVRVVDYWIAQAALEGVTEAKIDEARVVLQDAVEWRKRNAVKVPT